MNKKINKNDLKEYQINYLSKNIEIDEPRKFSIIFITDYF